jgi:ABC-type nitrate/sulfonate/bicarbonate transport system substrate-binding protein
MKVMMKVMMGRECYKTLGWRKIMRKMSVFKMVFFGLVLAEVLFMNGFAFADKELRMATSTQEIVNTTTLKMIEFLKPEGFQVKLLEHSGGAKSTQAIIAGEVDFAMGGADEIMLAVSKGAPIRAFSPSSQPKINYIIVAKTNIKTLQDLVGKRYGISGPAGFDNILARVALKKNGIDPESIKWTNIGGSGARAQALAADRIDACTVFLPNWLDLKTKGNFSKVVSLATEFPALTQSLYIAKITWLKENPSVAESIIRAQLRANTWAYNNKEEWVEKALGYIKGREKAVISETYDNLKEMGMFAADGGVTREGGNGLMELLFQSGDLTKRLEVNEWMALEYLDKVLKK